MVRFTIDKVIRFERECSRRSDAFVDYTTEEHKQIAEWLEELVDYRRFNGAKTFDNGFKQGEKYGYNKAIDDVMEKAKEIQEEQIKNLQHSKMRNRKQWAIYMNTHLEHIQVACKRLIAEQLKAGEN